MLLGPRPFLAIAVCVVSMLGLGCGDDDDAAGLGGVSSERTLNSLDTAEWTAACGDAQDLLSGLRDDDDVQRGLCLVAGNLATLFASDDEAQQACEDAYDQCIDTSQNPVSLGDSCSHLPADSCDITNGQLERCLRAFGDALRALGRDQSCAGAAADGGMLTTPIDDACDIIDARCPELFSGDTRGDAGVADGGVSSGADGGVPPGADGGS